MREILRKEHHHMKVLLNSFHLNGHMLGFHPQLILGLTLGVKGLIEVLFTVNKGTDKFWEFGYCPLYTGLTVLNGNGIHNKMCHR